MALVPPMMRRAANPDKGKAGKKHELSLAKRLGGTNTPGSGAVAGAKGDVRMEDFLGEGKTTQANSFAVTRDIMHKIVGEALDVGKVPFLSVCFVNSKGESKKTDRLIIMRECDWQELIDRRE